MKTCAWCGRKGTRHFELWDGRPQCVGRRACLERSKKRRGKDRYIGKKVHALPLNPRAAKWLKTNAGKGVEYTVVTLVQRQGEHLTFKASNGKKQEFGPHDMTWMPITTIHEENERLIELTAGVIADWIEPRDKLLALAIRSNMWRSNPPTSSQHLTI